MSWATRITQQHPYQSPEELAATEAQASPAPLVTSSSPEILMPNPDYEWNIAQLTSTVSHLSQVLAAVTTGTSAPQVEAGGRADLAILSHTFPAAVNQGPVPQIDTGETQHAPSDGTTLQVPMGQSDFWFRMPAPPLLDRGASPAMLDVA